MNNMEVVICSVEVLVLSAEEIEVRVPAHLAPLFLGRFRSHRSAKLLAPLVFSRFRNCARLVTPCRKETQTHICRNGLFLRRETYTDMYWNASVYRFLAWAQLADRPIFSQGREARASVALACPERSRGASSSFRPRCCGVDALWPEESLFPSCGTGVRSRFCLWRTPNPRFVGMVSSHESRVTRVVSWRGRPARVLRPCSLTPPTTHWHVVTSHHSLITKHELRATSHTDLDRIQEFLHLRRVLPVPLEEKDRHVRPVTLHDDNGLANVI